MRTLREQFEQYVKVSRKVPNEVLATVEKIEEPGKLADFIVLDRDLFSASPEELLEARVLRTYLGGREVYSAVADEGGP